MRGELKARVVLRAREEQPALWDEAAAITGADDRSTWMRAVLDREANAVIASALLRTRRVSAAAGDRKMASDR